MNLFNKYFFGLSLFLFFFDIPSPLVLFENNDYKGVPTVFLYGDIDGMETKDDERIVKFNYLSEDLSFMKYATIKIQGSSTIYYQKKNYTIKLYDEHDVINKYKVDFGWGEHNKYVLKANWSDKTHVRNIVGARVAASVSKKYNLFSSAPNNGNVDGFPVDVYLNGEYLGLYTFNIPKTDWMLGLDEENENHLAFGGEYNRDECFFQKEASYNMWELEVGIQNQANLDKLNRLYNFINNSSNQEFKDYFADYLNLDAMLNYYVLVETLMLEDNIGKNMILITYDGLVWYPVLYDMDAAFGVNPSGKFEYEFKNVSFDKSRLFSRFGDLFWNEICDRYFELRKDILTEAKLNKEVDEFYNSISIESLKKEEEKWKNIPGFEVTQIKNYIDHRFIYLDEYFIKR